MRLNFAAKLSFFCSGAYAAFFIVINNVQFNTGTYLAKLCLTPLTF